MSGPRTFLTSEATTGEIDLAAHSSGVSEFAGGDAGQWQDVAKCAGKTTLFFGPPGERPGRRQRREKAAKTICHSCPVLLQCRQAARLSRENGIWGGETEEERAAAGYPPRAITRRAVAGARRIPEDTVSV